MLKEFIEFMFQKGADSKKCRTFQSGADPKHIFYFEDADGVAQRRIAEPEPRDHKASSLDAIIEFANDERNQGAVVWYNRWSVSCMIDDATRRDKITLSIGVHPELQAMSHLLKNNPAFTQQQLILFLRTKMRDSVSADLINKFRRLKWSLGEMGVSVQEHTKRSLGKQVEANFEGEESIPEVINFTVGIFSNGTAARGTVQCAVDVDPKNQLFKLVPSENDIESCCLVGEDSIASTLKDHVKDRPIYYGQP